MLKKAYIHGYIKLCAYYALDLSHLQNLYLDTKWILKTRLMHKLFTRSHRPPITVTDSIHALQIQKALDQIARLLGF